MEILLAVVIGVSVLGFGALILALQRQSQQIAAMKDDSALGLLKQDLQGLHQLMSQNQNVMTEQLGKSQELMRDSIMKQFSESSKLITDVTNRLTKLDETNRRVVDVADELKMLQNVLPPDRFEMQYRFADGEVVDAVIKLDRDKMLPVDSKFSLENYNRLVEENEQAKRDELGKAIKADLKLRIDETAKYIRPAENTMDFAFMFIPSEAIFYDLLINKVGMANTSSRDLIEYAFRDKRVIIVSPTSFLAYLQTVLQGLRSLQIEEQAKEIQVRVGQLGQHLMAYDQFMQKLGNSLGTTVSHYNNAHKELKKVDKDIVKIAGTSPAIEPLLVDKPQAEVEA